MNDNQRNRFNPAGQEGDAENHRIGRELYNRDQQRNQPTHRSHDNHWDNGNNFHTGPSNQQRSHFPEDSHQRNSNADRGASISKHYGDREYSAYRNPNSLNYGDGRGNSTHHEERRQDGPAFRNDRSQQNQQNSQYSNHGDGRGNYSARQDSYGHAQNRVHSDDRISAQRRMDDSNENYYRGGYMDSRGVREELPRPDSNPYHVYPGSRSRYKDDDYRYGSGNHAWYEEQRYTDNSGRRVDRDKGDITGEMGEGVRDAWNTMKHDVQNLFNRNSDRHDDDHNRQNHDNRRHDQDSNRHDYEYRSRHDRGTERGPRWSDETDSGDDDNSRYNRGNNPRHY